MLLLVAFSHVAGAEVPAPDDVVRGTANEVLEFLRNAPEFPKVSVQKIADEVEQKVMPHFDLERMTGIAPGDDWDNATAAQRDVIQAEFHKLIAHALSAALAQYHGQSRLTTSPCICRQTHRRWW